MIPDNKNQDRIYVDTTHIACQADHPRVFYTPNKDGYVVCEYCNVMFVLKEDADTTTERLFVYDYNS